MANMFDSGYLAASLIWGSVGGGIFIYGWRQKSVSVSLLGLLVAAVSYFVESWLYMSIADVMILAGMYGWKQRMD